MQLYGFGKGVVDVSSVCVRDDCGACVMTAVRACGAMRCVALRCVLRALRAACAVNIHDVQVVCVAICE